MEEAQFVCLWVKTLWLHFRGTVMSSIFTYLCLWVWTNNKNHGWRRGCSCSYRSVGADGGESVGSTGKQPVPVHQQHPDVVLAFLLWKHTHTHHRKQLRAATIIRLLTGSGVRQGGEITLYANKRDKKPTTAGRLLSNVAELERVKSRVMPATLSCVTS